MNKILKCSLFALLVFFASCYKDVVIIDNTDIINKSYPKIEVDAEIVGRVHDENGNEINTFNSIFLNNIYNATNSPYYHFSAVDADKNGDLLTIELDKEKHQFLVKPIEDDVNYFSHSIIKNPILITESSIVDINKKLDNKILLKIKGNRYLQDKNAYSGNVVIKTFVPDLSNPNHLETLPGGHLGIDMDSNKVWLNFYEVVFINIASDTGSPLEIENGNASLTFANPMYKDCSIWRYDETNHIWQFYSQIENYEMIESKIIKSGFYSIAKSYIFNLVEGSVYIGDVPLINQTVDLFFEDKLVDRVYTTNSGKWFAHLPLNQPFKYRIDFNCNDIIEERFNLGENNAKIASMVIDKKLLSSVDITGVLKDCSNKEVNKNFFKITHNNNSKSYFFNSSDIDIIFPYCSEGLISIQSANEYWDIVGPEVVFHDTKKAINFYNLYACNQIEQDGYFNINIDGKEKLFSTTESKLEDGRTKLLVYDYENMNMDFYLIFSGKKAKEYNDQELNIFFKDLMIGEDKYDLNCSNSTDGCGFKKFKIESYGFKKGDWIKGNFEGLFWVKSYSPLRAKYRRIKVDFLIKRNFN